MLTAASGWEGAILGYARPSGLLNGVVFFFLFTLAHRLRWVCLIQQV